MRDEKQQRLPFEMAEASHADRRNMLAGALNRLKCDLYLSRLCLWIFDVTKGGIEGDLSKSYEELAARPFGLCCSVSKARTTVGQAARVGLIAVRERRYVSLGQQANAYWIDWDGVRRLLDYRVRPGSDRVSCGSTPMSPQDTPMLPQDTPLMNNNLFSSSLNSIDRSGERLLVDGDRVRTGPGPLVADGSPIGAEVDWAAVRREANQLCEKLDLHCREPRDRRLILGSLACALVGVLPRAWLDESLAGWRDNRHKHQRPFGYLHACMVNAAGDRGVDFRRWLRDLPIPAELLERRPSGTSADRLGNHGGHEACEA
jgi:hypothetical protein